MKTSHVASEKKLTVKMLQTAATGFHSFDSIKTFTPCRAAAASNHIRAKPVNTSVRRSVTSLFTFSPVLILLNVL